MLELKAAPYKDPALWILAIVITLKVVQDMFADISGGFVNPALALSQILWQNFTVQLDPDHAWD